jgi:spore maturation protein CgeB
MAHKGVAFKEIYNMFFRTISIEYKSGKAISSRHFEPIGTKTCQILLNGNYNGILKKDKHFIGIKKDLSDINEAIEKFKDIQFRQKIVNEAYEYVMENHTYDKRIEYLVQMIREIL